MIRTSSIKKDEIKRDWHLIDASNATLGRLSSKVAHIIRGKNKVNFTPHINMSDFVVVINADKVKLSGNKEKDKKYWSHSGFPGGGRFKSYKILKSDKPELIIKKSIKGMLPHNRLGNDLINNLKVYAGDSHPHKAQNPKKMEI